jgi:hypothetical protein
MSRDQGIKKEIRMGTGFDFKPRILGFLCNW